MRHVFRLLCLALLISLPLSAQAERRMALVIGMGNYEEITPLDNTRNDARAVGDTLEGIGFEVTRLEDAGHGEVEAALDQFAFESQVADVALIYFAGHGVEMDGVNYLVPVDVQPTSVEAIQEGSVTLKQMLETVDKARQIRIVILDACRDNPFSEEVSGSAAPAGSTTTNESAAGLAPAEPDPDTLVVFAARDGQVAFDGTGEHSPFAESLMAAFAEPGLEIGLMFRKVRDLVRQKTGNRQQSYTYGSLSSQSVYFIEPTVQPAVARVETPAGDDLAINDFEQLLALAENTANDSMATRSMKRVATIMLNDLDSARYDPEQAVAFLKRAAEAGDPEAMFQLARFYEQGTHVEVDEAKSLDYYRRSSDLGYARSINDLGFMYAQGLLGLQQDYSQAYRLFEKAAEERHPEALFNFATLIDQGQVPGRSSVEAAGYLFDAVRTGSAQVRQVLCERPEVFSTEVRAELQRVMQGYGFYSGAIDAQFGLGTTRGIALAFGTPEESIDQAALRTCQFD